jgi:hypothetical protein
MQSAAQHTSANKRIIMLRKRQSAAISSGPRMMLIALVRLTPAAGRVAAEGQGSALARTCPGKPK